MSLFNPSAYGDSCALFYDQLYPNVPAGLVRVLVALADGGPALELGLATGRVALPLRTAGVPVHGIDSSLLMLSQFRHRPRFASIHATAGDISALPFRPHFRLVFCLVSSIGLLPSPQLQLQCMREAFRVLQPGGAFLCETFDESAADRPSTQSHPVITPTGVQHYTVTFLPTPPQVLDHLATVAGLSLASRWGSWAQAPHSVGRPHCISVYRKPLIAA